MFYREYSISDGRNDENNFCLIYDQFDGAPLHMTMIFVCRPEAPHSRRYRAHCAGLPAGALIKRIHVRLMCMYSIFLKPAAEMFIMCIYGDIVCIIVDRESVALLSELDILKFIL